MSVTLVVTGVCLYCGWRGLGWSWRQAKPAMTTLRIVGVGVTAFPRDCDECGGPMEQTLRFELDAESRQRWDEWRERTRARRAARRAA